MKKNPPPELIAKVAARLRALGDENRLRILMRLREGPCCVGDLALSLGLAQPSVSKHLATLRDAGLVKMQREGTQTVCRVVDASIFDLCEVVCDGVVRHLREEHAALAMAAGIRSRKE